MGITEVCGRAVIHAFPQRGTSYAASMRAEPGEVRHNAMQLLGSDKPVLAGDTWPVPLPEEATAYAPRPGIEIIERRVKELLRQAQAIPRDDDESDYELSACTEQGTALSEKPQQESVPVKRTPLNKTV